MGYYPGFYYIGDGYLYWRDIDASAVVPAQGDYTTRITDLNYDPLYGLYGIDIGGTVLGSGNPGDDEVQFGLHMAVVRQACDGRWAKIMVWNSPAVLKLRMRVNKDTAYPWDWLTYRFKVTNLTPVRQQFVLDVPIPEHTTFRYVYGSGDKFYDPDSDSIHWEGIADPWHKEYLSLRVKIDRDTPVGTIITGEAHLTDDALGDSASVTTEVVGDP